MDKKKLLTVLTSLSVASTSVSVSQEVAAQQDGNPEKAGIAGAINPDVEGKLSDSNSRVLFVGSDIFRNESIKTGPDGTAHLMFADKSSLTIGPNSEVVIDKFVYQPDSQTGELALSASRGVLRFVGGALSKSGNVSVKTPVGTLGIRGGVMVIEIESGTGETYAFFLYGDEMTGVSNLTEASELINQSEHWLRITPSGEIIDEGELDLETIDDLLANFVGDDVEVQSWQGVNVPDNYIGWTEELSEEDEQDEERIDEEEAAEISS